MAQLIPATEAAIDRLPLGSGPYRIGGSARLDAIRGFGIICNPQSASFILQRKLVKDGKKQTVRVKLGTRGEITLAEAHAKAVAALKILHEGKNPNDAKRRRSDDDGRLTLKEVFDRYIADGVRAGKLSETTVAKYSSYFKCHLAPWGKQTMLDLGRSKAEIIALNDRLNAESGWASANGTIQLLRYLYKRAITMEDGLLADPTSAVVLTKERVRDTALNAADLRSWWSSVMLLPSPVKRAYWLVTALTGGRRNQISSAEWGELDWITRVWRFPDEHCKGGRGYEIPLSEFMVAFLTEWKRWVEEYRPNTPYIFPGKEGGHLVKPRNEKQGLGTASHALRHTYETARVALGLSEAEALMLLGHSLQAGRMSHRYVTREKVDKAALAKRQEQMTGFYLQALGISQASIPGIIWSKVSRSAWKKARV
jgi:integrase